MRRGFVQAVLALLALTAAVFAFLAGTLHSELVGHPSESLLIAVAEIDAALLIAYVVVIAWLVQASRSRRLVERETRLGRLLAFGAAGLIAIAIALSLSQRARAGNWIWVDTFFLALALAASLLLGTVVVMQPLVVHEWLDGDRNRWRSRRIPRPPIRSRRP